MQIKADLQGMSAVQDDLAQASAQIHQILQTVNENAKSLVATWTGPAQQHYYAQQSQWNQAAADMSRNFSGHQRALGQMHENIGNNENHIIASFQ